jgi:hypothetical protein
LSQEIFTSGTCVSRTRALRRKRNGETLERE